ncbi:MAG: biotin transporter BioY [Clostridiales bacterium]|nr:biotin transporter BioY [Clostridiales bacterium]
MKIRTMTRVALFAALTAVGAFIRIPLGYSSITLQTFFTAMAGCVLGPWYGALSQLVYVALGLVGLPIFTQGGGIGYLVQPTCAFLIGLIPAAWVIGRIAGRKPEPKQIVPACLLGYGVLYAIGVPYMALILNTFLGKGMGFSAIMWAGMIPFLPGDMIKILCITLLMPPILRQLDKLDK